MLILHNLGVQLDGAALFTSLDLTVSPGSVETIMGPSGCGKSTLLAAISGTLSHRFTVTGDIMLNGKRLNTVSVEKRKVGILFQDDLLFPHMDVFGNLAFGMQEGVAEKERKEIIEETLVQADLAGFAKRDVATLSGGQKARISLLRSLLAHPDALMFDEPFSKLDQELRESFRDFVFQQIEQQNIPALLVTHDRQDCLHDKITLLQRFA